MGLPAIKPATYNDILALPEHVVGEIIRGVLRTHPRPAPKHARAYSSLGGELHGPFDHDRNGPGGWWILDEPELHLGADVVVPDLAGWKMMPASPSRRLTRLRSISPACGRTRRSVHAHFPTPRSAIDLQVRPPSFDT